MAVDAKDYLAELPEDRRAAVRARTEELISEEERARYPHMTPADWALLGRLRSLAGGIRAAGRGAGAPTFEEAVLAALAEQTELLRDIRDRLRPTD